MDNEDILADALEMLGGKPLIDDSVITYGPLVLTIAPKEGKANTLLADHLFSPALFLAERIERGLLDVRGKTVIELGAGCALPSLLLSTSPRPPALVVVTDYPDEGILGNLKKNVERNGGLITKGCRVECRGYDWGSDASQLLNLAKSYSTTRSGYDNMILSDLLYFHDSHDILVSSIRTLLSKTKDAKVYVVAGKYTHPHVCNNFLEKAKVAGLLFVEELSDRNDDIVWKGTQDVSNLSTKDLCLRKANCRYWVGRWDRGFLTREM